VLKLKINFNFEKYLGNSWEGTQLSKPWFAFPKYYTPSYMSVFEFTLFLYSSVSLYFS